MTSDQIEIRFLGPPPQLLCAAAGRWRLAFAQALALCWRSVVPTGPVVRCDPGGNARPEAATRRGRA